MRTILFGGAARQWSLRVALLAGLAALLVTFSAGIGAQDQPEPPAWFYGDDARSYVGAQVKAFNQNGDELPASDTDVDVVEAGGQWSRTILSSDATMVTFRIVHSTGTLESRPQHVVDGSLTKVSITQFSAITDTASISVRIIARRADDGRIEFGMRGPDGQDILPPARFFPAAGPGHSNWLRSTEIDFGDGFVGRIIARHVEGDGRTEFGFRVEGYDDIFPRARFFPASGPEHNRFLRSSEIEISRPR